MSERAAAMTLAAWLDEIEASRTPQEYDDRDAREAFDDRARLVAALRIAVEALRGHPCRDSFTSEPLDPDKPLPRPIAECRYCAALARLDALAQERKP